MKKVLKILSVALLSGWMTFNMKLLDPRTLVSIEHILAQHGHAAKLTEGSVITDGKNLILVVVKTSRGSTIEILGDRQKIHEIKETY
ncbi:MAG: hypothetical protein JRI33_07800 [Deltaproteobacteria bacterium]|nr:hypothetical protein [Deltaproteobacteria bacterium]